MALDDDIRDRLDRLGFGRIWFGRDTTDEAALERLERLAALGRELAELCEQRSTTLRDDQAARP
ncbi:MAG: hypothetical protein ABIQ18_47745 [Umezawaea sp.]